ncbi:MAG: hypothetical protein ACKO3W_03255 [bacterium]
MTTPPASVPLLKRPRVVSAAVAAALVVAAAFQFGGGVAAVPDPIVELLRALFEYSPELSARLIASSTAAAAIAIVVFGVLGTNRFLPITACAVAAFVALACVSRALSAGGLGFPLLSLVVAGGLLLGMLRTQPSDSSARRGLSPGWTVLGLLVLATATGAIAGRATDPNRLANAAGVTGDGNIDGASEATAAPTTKVINIDLDMHPYEGRRIEETPLANYLPTLPTLARGKTTIVVFYMPNCNACHSIFRQFFSMPRVEQVFMVEIPAAVGIAHADTGEEPEPIECVGCEPLLLATGPNYLVASPMVVKIEDSVVTCVSDRFKGECLLPQ